MSNVSKEVLNEEIFHQRVVKNAFQMHYRRWKGQTVASKDEAIYDNKHYRAIIEMGPDVIPYLIDDLENEPGFLFNALRRITGENPIKDKHVGNISKMNNDWRNWYKNVFCKKRFNGYFSSWLNEIKSSSSSDTIYNNENYKKIVAMGYNAVPFIMNQLRINPEYLYKALAEISGHPVIKPENKGDFKKMTEDCIEWYEKQKI
jgi:hypothetical protein